MGTVAGRGEQVVDGHLRPITLGALVHHYMPALEEARRIKNAEAEAQGRKAYRQRPAQYWRRLWSLMPSLGEFPAVTGHLRNSSVELDLSTARELERRHRDQALLKFPEVTQPDHLIPVGPDPTASEGSATEDTLASLLDAVASLLEQDEQKEINARLDEAAKDHHRSETAAVLRALFEAQDQRQAEMMKLVEQAMRLVQDTDADRRMARDQLAKNFEFFNS